MIDSLFYRSALTPFLAARLQQISEQLAEVCEQQLAANSDSDIQRYVEAQLSLTPLSIFRDNIQHSWVQKPVGLMDDRDTLVFGPRDEVPGVEIRVEIPYAGSVELWHLTSNAHRLSFPMGEPWPSADNPNVGLLCLEYSLPLSNVEQEAKQRFEQDLADIQRHIDAQAQEIEHFHQQLQQQVSAAIKEQRRHLSVVEKIPQLLGVPLKRNELAPEWPDALQPTVVKPLRASAAAEPELLEEQFAHILKIIRLEGMSFERAPTTFQHFGEEALRDIILAHLNGHYEGSATGETFNKSGKTDIHIPIDGRSAFIAECKVWKGRKSVIAAIEQLQQYLTWRDCRAAVVVFNKHVAGFHGVLTEVSQWLAHHSELVALDTTSFDNEWRLTLRSAEDPQRLIHVQLMVFNLYCSE